MYAYLQEQQIPVDAFVEDKIRNKALIFGFGHRIYRNWDPRARIMYNMLQADDILYAPVDHLRQLAFQLVNNNASNEYFTSRHIFPNPDLFNNIFYHLFGMPSRMNPVMLSLSRVLGWLAHYSEQLTDKLPIMRPQEIYK